MELITKIHWYSNWLHDQYDDLQLLYQWTASHDSTFGSDFADRLANRGRYMLSSSVLSDASNWIYISLKAVCNRAKYPIYSDLQTDLQQSITHSRFGKTYKYHPWYHPLPPTWKQAYRNSLPLFTRNDIRILISIRTGHDYFNYYRHQQLKRLFLPPDPSRYQTFYLLMPFTTVLSVCLFIN